MRLVSWLVTPYDRNRLPMFAAVMLVVNLAYGLVVGIMLHHWGWLPENKGAQEVMSQAPVSVLLSLAGVAFTEELIFRLLPFGVAAWLRAPDWVVPGLLVVTSAAFGWIHGSPANILVQGVIGVFLALVFLKAGGWDGRAFQGWYWCAGVHFAFNCSLWFLVLALG